VKRFVMLLIAAAVFALWAQAGSAQAPTTTTLSLYEATAGSTFSLVDNAPRSPVRNPESRRFRFSVGDEILLSNPVFDRKGGTRLGTLYGNGRIIRGRTFASASVMIDVVIVFANGDQLNAHGVFAFSQDDVRVAIIGGTGAYAGARGSVVSHSNDDGSSQDTITLLP
jgi:hypothetical protein